MGVLNVALGLKRTHAKTGMICQVSNVVDRGLLNCVFIDKHLTNHDFYSSLVLMDSQTPPDALLFRARVKAIMQNPLYGGSLPCDPDVA
jgi:hypothetical protein